MRECDSSKCFGTTASQMRHLRGKGEQREQRLGRGDYMIGFKSDAVSEEVVNEFDRLLLV
jgi:uncharacterized protein (DUF1919 family)